MNIVQKPINYNFNRGRTHPPIGIVIHTEVGSQAGTYSWFNNPAAKASAHYNIGLDGSIWQHVSENDRPWAQGIVDRPSSPLVKSKGSVNPNEYVISIEHEDRGNSADRVRTNEQYEASGWLVAEICRRWGIPNDTVHIIDHREIRASKTCPGGLDTFRIMDIANRYLNPPPPSAPQPTIFDQVQRLTGNVTLYSDVPLVKLPEGNVIKVLPIGSVIELGGSFGEYYMSKYSLDNKQPNFFSKAATIEPAPPPTPEPTIWDRLERKELKVTLYKDTNLIEVPSEKIIKPLLAGTELEVGAEFNGTLYITKYSLEKQVPYFFSKEATIKPQEPAPPSPEPVPDPKPPSIPDIEPVPLPEPPPTNPTDPTQLPIPSENTFLKAIKFFLSLIFSIFNKKEVKT